MAAPSHELVGQGLRSVQPRVQLEAQRHRLYSGWLFGWSPCVQVGRPSAAAGASTAGARASTAEGAGTAGVATREAMPLNDHSEARRPQIEGSKLKVSNLESGTRACRR